MFCLQVQLTSLALCLLYVWIYAHTREPNVRFWSSINHDMDLMSPITPGWGHVGVGLQHTLADVHKTKTSVLKVERREVAGLL